MLRTLFIAVGLTLYILVVGPPLILYAWITKDPDPVYWAGVKGVMFFVRAVGVRVRVLGLERIPPGVCLFVANHTSSADAPAVVGAIPRRIAIILKESLFKFPIVGQAFSSAHFVPVNRNVHDSAIASVEKATEILRAGQSFLIYPEGTRSPDGRLQRFKKGAVMMAINSGVPIMPMACSGAHRIMGKRSLVIHPGEIVVEFLEPIDTKGYSIEQRDILNEKVRAAMAAGLPPDQRPLDRPEPADEPLES
ncbi:MAG TPA: lysophospholipid acyltransferase family protein [Candidatus Acidoferrum sp.]|nr:lysophospholipid acyltransferase family protein [Candidatus Acidoferrum sp.]